ncbi:Uncharacterized protein dnl_19070 [Desulfonema limicola]|uniref:Uncharacterized protein n=1 Tax=Desulfonema limicola TaxID=45656 RepID=A0A975GFU7_9BACT|nr:Uncharacterized protein dnl_19070 [Desulfonema limicola]
MAALAARAATGACPYGCYEIFDEVLTSFNKLQEWVDEILLNFGSQYLIEFS